MYIKIYIAYTHDIPITSLQHIQNTLSKSLPQYQVVYIKYTFTTITIYLHT